MQMMATVLLSVLGGLIGAILLLTPVLGVLAAMGGMAPYLLVLGFALLGALVGMWLGQYDQKDTSSLLDAMPQHLSSHMCHNQAKSIVALENAKAQALHRVLSNLNAKGSQHDVLLLLYNHCSSHYSGAQHNQITTLLLSQADSLSLKEHEVLVALILSGCDFGVSNPTMDRVVLWVHWALFTTIHPSNVCPTWAEGLPDRLAGKEQLRRSVIASLASGSGHQGDSETYINQLTRGRAHGSQPQHYPVK